MDLYIGIKQVKKESFFYLGTRGMAAVERFEDRCAQLYRKAFQKRLKVEGAPIAIYHNQHFDGQLDDLEIGLPVSGKDEDIKEMPGGTFACTIHNGPHGTLPITWALMGVWLEKNGCQPTGAPYAQYVRGGNGKIVPPEQYITELYVPIAAEEELPAFDFGEDFGKAADDLLK